MTESTCVGTMHKWPVEDLTGSIGELIANLDLKLVNDDGKNFSQYA